MGISQIFERKRYLVKCDLVVPGWGEQDPLRTEGSVWEGGVRFMFGKRRRTS